MPVITLARAPHVAAEDTVVSAPTDDVAARATTKPVVTVNENPGNRTLRGTVSRTDVTWAITVDDQPFTDTPTITPAPAGTSDLPTWSVAVPAVIADGSHTVSIVATTVVGTDDATSTPLVSDPVTTMVTIATSPVVPPVEQPPVVDTPPENQGDITVASGLETIAAVPEIGQFIAPEVPTSTLEVKKQLYGVSVDDLVPAGQAGISSVINGQKAATASVGSILGVDTEGLKSNKNATPVQSSESGWKIFGVAWYWLLGGVAFVVLLTGRIMQIARRRPQQLQTVPSHGMINQYD